MIKVSENIRTLQPSPTLEIKKTVDRLLGEGRTICNFGIGELNPEIKTPPELVDEIIGSLKRDETHYSPSTGDPELLEALSEDFKGFGLGYPPSQIVVCPGPKDAFFKACLAVLDPMAKRNRVVAFSPIFESYEQVPRIITGQAPIILPTDEHFQPELGRLEDLLKRDETIAAVVLNSPNNPTGAVYPESIIRGIASVLKGHEEITVLSDEVYRTVRYDETPYTSIAAELPETTLYISGISKELSATGLRLGFVAGPSAAVEAISTIEGNTSSCVHLPTQKGVARFLRKDRDNTIRSRICRQLRTRREKFMELFTALIPDARLDKPKGAFYAFPEIQSYLGRKTAEGKAITDDQSLALYLLNEAGVACIPGSLFYRPGHLRFAYAVGIATIEEGLSRMGKALEKLSG